MSKHHYFLSCPHCKTELSVILDDMEGSKKEKDLIKNPFYDSDFALIDRGMFNREEGVVCITKDFYMQTTPVTQLQWHKVMGTDPSNFVGINLPVTNVSWNDVQEFIEKLNTIEGKEIYRLPTEAEWEYACRAGSTSHYCFGDDESLLTEYAWYEKNSSYRTHPVGTKKPNDWGLYDMHGNVWEWCKDWYSPYPHGKVTDPMGPSMGSYRVIRGGGWGGTAVNCRLAHRDCGAPDGRVDFLGFRLVKKCGAEKEEVKENCQQCS